jgi:hypothetical protein
LSSSPPRDRVVDELEPRVGNGAASTHEDGGPIFGQASSPMERIRLSRAELAAAADPKWAAARPVYDCLARRRYDELAPRQRVAQLALFYSNEIGNGGHLQYFHNQGIGRADDLLAALDEIGAAPQREIFAAALEYAREHPVEPADSLQDYSDRAYEREFWDLDNAFYACRPEIGGQLLPDYIHAHLGDFIELE